MDLSSFQNGTNQVLPVTDTKLVYLSALSPSIRQLNLRYVRLATHFVLLALLILISEASHRLCPSGRLNPVLTLTDSFLEISVPLHY